MNRIYISLKIFKLVLLEQKTENMFVLFDNGTNNIDTSCVILIDLFTKHLGVSWTQFTLVQNDILKINCTELNF